MLKLSVGSLHPGKNHLVPSDVAHFQEQWLYPPSILSYGEEGLKCSTMSRTYCEKERRYHDDASLIIDVVKAGLANSTRDLLSLQYEGAHHRPKRTSLWQPFKHDHQGYLDYAIWSLKQSNEIVIAHDCPGASVYLVSDLSRFLKREYPMLAKWARITATETMPRSNKVDEQREHELMLRLSSMGEQLAKHRGWCAEVNNNQSRSYTVTVTKQQDGQEI